MPPATPSAESMPRGRPFVSGHHTPQGGDGPAVWLPWVIAPVWVLLPIFGCLVAGAIRRPAVAHTPPVPAAAESDSPQPDLAPLVPIAPLAVIEP